MKKKALRLQNTLQDRILKIVIGGLFFLLCFFQNSFSTVYDPGYDEVLMTVRMDQMEEGELAVLIRKKEIFLPIVDIFNYLQVKCNPSKGLDSISGFYINEENEYLFDVRRNRITYKDTKHDIKRREIVKTETNLYLQSENFSKIFGLNCVLDFRSLTISLNSKLELPAVRKARIEQIRKNINRSLGVFEADSNFAKSRPFFDFGTADWFLNIIRETEGNFNFNMKLALGSSLFGGTFKTLLTYDVNQPFREREQNYLWEYANDDLSLIRQIKVGKISPVSISTISDPVVGLQFSNIPITVRKSFGTQTISDYTQPYWTVELYVNDILMDYLQADEEGFFTFEIPLIYGSSNIMLRFYGPYGEERTSFRKIEIPTDVLPVKVLEYQASSGMIQDGNQSIFMRSNANYGLTRWMTLGGGTEGIFRKSDYKMTSFINTTVRLTQFMILNGEYIHKVRVKGLLSFRFRSGFQCQLDYNKYDPNQKVVINRYAEERKIKISKPFRIFSNSAFTRFTVSQNIQRFAIDTDWVNVKYEGLEWFLSSRIKGVNTKFSTSALFSQKNILNLSSSLTTSAILGKRFILQTGMRYNFAQREMGPLRVGLDKRFGKNGFIRSSFEYNPSTKRSQFNIGIQYDFSFARLSQSSNFGNNFNSQALSASGSLAYQSHTKRFMANKNPSNGKGGLIFQAFIDANRNGKRDRGEPKADGLNVRRHGGSIKRNASDSTVVVMGLAPFSNYHIELDGSQFESISWRISKPELSVQINPNQIRFIEVPVEVNGEGSGTVYLQNGENEEEIGRIKVNFYDSDSVLVTSVLSEPDGYYTYFSFEPGNYVARPDPVQMKNLGLTAEPASIPFTIKQTFEGDFVDGLKFVLRKKNTEP